MVALVVIGILDRLGIEHHLGGSYASSIHGTPRQTQDVDLVVDLELEAIPGLIDALGRDFYAEPISARRAVAAKSSFNVVHLSTGVKIDLFCRGDEPFDDIEFERAQPVPIYESEDVYTLVRVKTVEDTILRKLQWYRLGGEQSDRQWTDVLGCLKGQSTTLDYDHLNRWGRELGIEDLLERAIGET